MSRSCLKKESQVENESRWPHERCKGSIAKITRKAAPACCPGTERKSIARQILLCSAGLIRHQPAAHVSGDVGQNLSPGCVDEELGSFLFRSAPSNPHDGVLCLPVQTAGASSAAVQCFICLCCLP